MKKYFLIFAIFFATILSGCGSDEPENNLFKISVEADDDAKVKLSAHYCTVEINGLSQEISFTISGDFDSFNLSDNIPDWISTSISGNTILISVPSLSGEEIRKGNVGFTVFKGSQTNTGYVEIIQSPLTYETLLNRERKYIDKLPFALYRYQFLA